MPTSSAERPTTSRSATPTCTTRSQARTPTTTTISSRSSAAGPGRSCARTSGCGPTAPPRCTSTRARARPAPCTTCTSSRASSRARTRTCSSRSTCATRHSHRSRWRRASRSSTTRSSPPISPRSCWPTSTRRPRPISGRSCRTTFSGARSTRSATSRACARMSSVSGASCPGDRRGTPGLDGKGRPDTASASLLAHGTPDGAPATDLYGRKRGDPPAIGAVALP